MVLGEEEIAMSDSIYFKKCQDCTFTIRATCTKIFIESCDRIRFNFEGKVITHTVEVWKCKGFEAMFKTPVKTLQVDLCEGVKVEWEKSDDFNRVVWSATEDLSLSFGDSGTLTIGNHLVLTHYIEEHKINVGSQKMAKLNPNVNPETDQFIIRLLPNKITNKPTLLNELIVRLENGFPTTEREARQFEERQEANLQALARELLGKDVAIGKKKAVNVKVNRNGPCVCGSDKKYKKCCGTNAV